MLADDSGLWMGPRPGLSSKVLRENGAVPVPNGEFGKVCAGKRFLPFAGKLGGIGARALHCLCHVDLGPWLNGKRPPK